MLMLTDYRVRQRDYLLEISRALTAQLDLGAVLRKILQAAAEMLSGQAGLIALRQDDGSYAINASYGISPRALDLFGPLLSDLPEHADASGWTIPGLERKLTLVAHAVRLSLQQVVALPMTVGDQLVGAIYIFRAHGGRFSSDERQVLESFADQAAIAVNNARLYQEVAREKRRLDAILEASADGVLILDPAHRVTVFNRALARMTGLSAAQALQSLHDDVIRLQNQRAGMTLAEAEAGGWPLTGSGSLYVEGDLVRPDGSRVSVGITYAPLLDREGRLVNVTTVRESAAVIEEEADRLTQLIDNLLDASRLQAGGLKLNLGDVALDQMAQRLVEKFRTQTSQHVLSVDFPPAWPAVQADAARLEQVLSNLIGNAIKYSPTGGAVRVAGRALPDEVIVSVSDEGIGIPVEEQARIFERFYRVDDALSRRTAGSGLGLYLAKAVIDAHGGRIWVESIPGYGA
ncbi:MAG: putative two-component sensor histidine kinase, partial [Chloroflexi bacterium]|nr:putative two-component sensor histidine kinase [Chloroflexota bacterium]